MLVIRSVVFKGSVMNIELRQPDVSQKTRLKITGLTVGGPPA